MCHHHSRWLGNEFLSCYTSASQVSAKEGYREVLSAFGSWAVKIAKIIEHNPIRVIERRNVATDRRKTRRALTVDEARQLLEVSTGRRLYYATAILTGLRVAEIKQLEWSDIFLTGDKPHIQLRASTTKAGRADRVDLHPDLVAMLGRAKLAAGDKLNVNRSLRVFNSIPKLDTFKADLVRAGIAKRDDKTELVDTRDEQGRTLDRHCLRYTFVSWLGAAGIDLRIAQRLARHTDVKLTAVTYQDAG